MPPSQLKRLKASLREQGITGPQKSKKEKKNPKNTNADARAKKNAALSAIREASNPFDFKHLSRPKKFEYATNRPEDANKVLGRPGVTKSMGEETRRKTLLPEMNRRNKVGGIMDRRIGENDPTMTADDRMMARFEREQQRKRGNVFDLEEADDEVELTHGGKSITFDPDATEDYDAASISGDSAGDSDNFLQKKRRRSDIDEGDVDDAPQEEQPDRKKTKAEVMKEVIAKSKMHKYERQQQKEDDDDLRDELDKGLPDILAALRGHISKKDLPAPASVKQETNNDFGINPDRAALLGTSTRAEADKEYDIRVRQMLSDQKAKPTERTKTEIEKAKEEAERFQALEKKRLKRMRGELDSESEDDAKDEEEDQELEEDDAREFGLAGTRPAGVDSDEEDDFIIDDLVASDSEAELSEGSEVSEDDMDDTMGMGDDDDEDFLDILKDPEAPPKATNGVLTIGAEPKTNLPYTYSCPRSLEEVTAVFAKVNTDDIPKVVQRIRAQYHAGLNAENKNKLADFACALVDWLANSQSVASLAVQENVIRHIHSLCRAYAIAVGTRFRHHLKRLQAIALSEVTPGDLILLTAIGSIFETSAHFEQVSTPAITIIAKWLGLANAPTSAKDITVGAYLGALCLQYQRISKRHIPELVRFTVLCLKSEFTTKATTTAHCKNIATMIDLWSPLPAFIEIVQPILGPLKSLQPQTTQTTQRLQIALQTARLKRRPQELHHHRPLPIKTSIPKFEESFDPNKHYDPDRERAESNKLRKEYKREKKGAIRELRKDANFIARERLRDKKEKDKAYEEKYRRLVADIQGEEGREANAYEREKKARKRNN